MCVQRVKAGRSIVWLGLAGERANMGNWLGSQEEGWVVCIGDGLKCHAARRLSSEDRPTIFASIGTATYDALEYGPGWDGLGPLWGGLGEKRVVMRVDMDKRKCSFVVSVHGK